MIKVKQSIYYNIVVIYSAFAFKFRKGDDDDDDEKKKENLVPNQDTSLNKKKKKKEKNEEENENVDKNDDEDNKEKINEEVVEYDYSTVNVGEETNISITNNSIIDDLLNFVQQHPYKILITLMLFGMLFYNRSYIIGSIRDFLNYITNTQTEQVLIINNVSNVVSIEAIEGELSNLNEISEPSPLNQIEQQQDNQSQTAELKSDSNSKQPKLIQVVNKPSKFMVMTIANLIKWGAIILKHLSKQIRKK
jgi:hypothetical protein